jgi:uncharacterized protein (DUF1330 family)
MPAYVISEVTVRDPDLAETYRDRAARSIEQHGGRYLVRAFRPVAAEGIWPPNHLMVIVEFPTMDQLRRWYVSAEYAEALTLRTDALERRLLFADGL